MFLLERDEAIGTILNEDTSNDVGTASEVQQDSFGPTSSLTFSSAQGITVEGLEDGTDGAEFYSLYTSNGDSGVITPSDAGVMGGESSSDAPLVLLGDSQDNVLVGTEAAEIIRGRAGADRLEGNGGLDSLFGGRGADVLVDGEGKDVMKGGRGRDTFVLLDNGDTDVILDFGKRDLISFGSGLQYEDLQFADNAIYHGDRKLAVFANFNAESLTQKQVVS